MDLATAATQDKLFNNASQSTLSTYLYFISFCNFCRNYFSIEMDDIKTENLNTEKIFHAVLYEI